MVSSKILSLFTLTILPLCLAAPAPAPEALSTVVAAEDWKPIDFEGKTLYINKAAIQEGSVNPNEEVTRALNRRAPDSDTCDGASVNSHPAPFANVGDCAVIRDWASGQNTWWSVRMSTPDSHGILYYGTCVFEAGTRNICRTYIGSSNIADITRLAIDRWGASGVVASTGSSACENDCHGVSGPSNTKWTLKHS